MARPRTEWLALCLLLPAWVPACNGDSPEDAMPPGDIDNGTCGETVRFTGEYVDWDEGGGSFCGIFGAAFRAREGGGTSTTAPNGRFDLCVPDQPITLVDITPPSQPSSCSTPPGSYTLPAIAVAARNVTFAGAAWSSRAFVMGRQAVDPSRAQVVIHVHGTPSQVSLGAAHGPAQARNGTAWAAGDTGQVVFFPDVEVGGGDTTVSAPGAVVPDRIPLVAGTLTHATIVVR